LYLNRPYTLKGMKFSEPFNLGRVTSSILVDIMLAKKQSQSKAVDADDKIPRTRQRTKLIENNDNDNRGTSVSWSPALAPLISPHISPKPSNIAPLPENYDT
jgi:hypothetical protein